jgi:hypothetical protein
MTGDPVDDEFQDGRYSASYGRTEVSPDGRFTWTPVTMVDRCRHDWSLLTRQCSRCGLTMEQATEMMTIADMVEYLEKAHADMRELRRKAEAAQFAHEHPDVVREIWDDIYRPSKLT